MDPDRFRRVKEIFQDALALDGELRSAYLDEACGDDEELRDEVERLLSTDGELTGFLDTPHTTGLPPGWSPTSLVGTRIGDCRLERVISSGGMGTVYEAIQEPPSRTVAVKVMKQGVVSKSALRRFEFEAQIMAGLNHPHIAQVFEAGTCGEGEAGGLPFLVMEYVPDAMALTEYASNKNLAVRERLDLFLQVCEAVHYGHGKGVIHRDLKPSNILVDAKGRVKVIDFGVARATNSDLALTSLQTEVGQLLGTLQYMSPEQCEADPDKLDIRSDVYALGVVLYELLCGGLPYDVRRTAMLEAARLIQEEPPRPPSTTNRTLRGDVETIVLKALEKERRRRYQTVQDFETDIRRYLRGEVILARPAGAGRRFAKLVRRNPVISSVTLVAVLCLGGFLSYILFWSYPRLQEEKAKLEVEAGNTVLVNEFLREMLSWADPFKEGGEIPVTEMLDRAAGRIDTEFPDRPGIEAALRHTLGITYRSNGRYEEALRQLLKSVELYRGLESGGEEKALVAEGALGKVHLGRGEYATGRDFLIDYLERSSRTLGPDHPLVFTASRDLGQTYMELDQYEEAETVLVECLAGQERVLGEGDTRTLSTRGTLAQLYQRMGRFEEARSLHEKTVEAWRREKGDDHPYTLAARESQAGLYDHQQLYQESIPLHEGILEAGRRALGDEHPATLRMMSSLAHSYTRVSRYEEAEALLLEALDGQRRVAAPEHPNTLSMRGDLAAVLGRMGRSEAAEPIYLEVLEASRRTLGEDHRNTVGALSDLAVFYYNLGRDAEAEPMLVEVLERYREEYGDDHNETLSALNNLAGLYWRQGRYEEAEPLFIESLAAKRRLLGEESMSTLTTLNNLASLYLMQERCDEAEPLFEQALEALRKAFGDDHMNTISLLGNLATLYFRQGRYDESERLFLESLEGLKKKLSDDHWAVLDTRTELAMLYAAQGRLEEAEAVHLDTLERKRRTLGEDNRTTLITLQRLAELYEFQKRFEEAEPLAQDLLERTPTDSEWYPERKALLDRLLAREGD